MRARLTESSIARLKPTDRDQFLFDTQLGSFGYRLTPAGRGIFFVGKPRRTVGYHPDIKATEARERARVMLVDLRAGRDPAVAHEERARAAKAGAMTIAELGERWLGDYVRPKLKPRTVFDYEWLLRNRVFPAVGHLRVDKIARADAIAMHVAQAATPRRANYALRVLGTMMSFAIELGLRPPADNPCRKIRQYREKQHERYLTEAEIGRAAEAIDEAERDGAIWVHAAAGLRLCLLTGARSGEITAVKWAHVNWDGRIIRLPDSKTNVPRTIHLSDAALEVLRTLPRVEPYIIAGAKPGEPYRNLRRAWIVARARRGLDDVRLHDLRHSFASLAVNRGVSLPMIGKLLGHKHQATTQRYAHIARDAAAAVNDALGAAMAAAIEKRAPAGGTVVKLRRPRRRAAP
jgi:integrase